MAIVFNPFTGTFDFVGAGTPGAAGAPGSPGAPGTDGEDGVDGLPGEAGTAGSAGATGATGAAGATGLPGPPGLDGQDGDAIDLLIRYGLADPGGGDGLVVRKGMNNTVGGRTIQSPDGSIDVTNGSGVSGNPLLFLSTAFTDALYVRHTAPRLGALGMDAQYVEEASAFDTLAGFAASSMFHRDLQGRGGDQHADHAYLLGRSGGQSYIGGSASGNHLDLSPNTSAVAAANTGRVRALGPVQILPVGLTDVGNVLGVAVGAGAAWATSAGDLHQCLVFNPLITYTTTTPLFGLLPQVFSGQPTFTVDVTNTIQAAPLYYSGPTYVAANGRTVTLSDLSITGSFWDAPTFNRAGTGVYDAAAAYNGFVSAFTVGSGATIPTRRGFRVANGGGAGSVTTQIGVQIDALTKGGTQNSSLVSLGSSVDMRHAGPAVFGANAAPTNASCALEVQSTTKAFVLPRMTTAQRDAIATIINGMMIYNTTTNTVQGRAAGAWVSL